MKTSVPFAPSPGSAALPAAAARPRLGDFVALTKPRLNALVVATTFGGFYLASGEGVDVARLANAVAGTWLVAASAAALNQVIEQKTDALMRRTRTRPLPDGRLQPLSATGFAVLVGLLGLAQLWVGATPLASGVALVTLVTYVAVYTPLKRRTSVATLIGGILALLLVGETINVSSTIGLIALFGICVQNDVILVAKINDLRRRGMSLREAVVEGAVTKFRPIFMTDMVMIVSVLPLALIVTTGAELHRPLAVVYIGGFFFAILLRLFIVPILYETLSTWQK